jgi:oligoribonuclease NrnB/cAMP/cGMP phosphodiesterase (DHH superfamily)
MSLQALCLYHRSDMDGICSGAIINYYHSLRRQPVHLIGVDYTDKIQDLNLHKLDINYDTTIVYIVDFSFSVQDMITLSVQFKHLCWIDHHESAIKKSKENNYFYLKGKREVGKAGCELTWEYLFENKEMPRVVKLLGRYDVWDIDYSPDILPLQSGIRLYECHPDNLTLWKDLFTHNNKLDLLLSEGLIVLRSREINHRNIVNSPLVYPIIIDGHKFLSVNQSNFNSLAFKDYDKRYGDVEAYIVWYYSGSAKLWKVSLYRSPNSNLNILQIAQSYGGGGHQNACGFVSDQLPSFLLG